MDTNYKSIKCYSSTMNKIDWIRQLMKSLGYNLNKSQTLDLALAQYAKMLLKMNLEANGK